MSGSADDHNRRDGASQGASPPQASASAHHYVTPVPLLMQNSKGKRASQHPMYHAQGVVNSSASDYRSGGTFFFLCLGIMLLGIFCFIGGMFFHRMMDTKVELSSQHLNIPSGTLSSIAGLTSLKGAHTLIQQGERHLKSLASSTPSASSHASSGTKISPSHQEKASSTPSVSQEAKKKPSTPQKQYALQFGIFASRENAEDLMRRLRTRHTMADVVKKKDGHGVVVYCVIGTHVFGTHSAAQLASNTTMERDDLSTVVVPVEQESRHG